MSELTYAGILTVESCWCGIHHAIPAELHRQAIEHGTAVYCPLGHSWVFTSTKDDEVRERAERAEAALARERARSDQARADAEHQRRRAAAARGQATKARKRAAGGACPCCNRTFVDVARHVATKHPNFDPEVKP